MIRNINNILTGWLNYIKGELNILNPEIKEKAVKRLSICETCPRRVQNKCGVCGCYLPAKVSDSNSKCPENKW